MFFLLIFVISISNVHYDVLLYFLLFGLCLLHHHVSVMCVMRVMFFLSVTLCTVNT